MGKPFRWPGVIVVAECDVKGTNCQARKPSAVHVVKDAQSKQVNVCTACLHEKLNDDSDDGWVWDTDHPSVPPSFMKELTDRVRKSTGRE